MATVTKTILDITLVTLIDDPSLDINEMIEAEIVDADNNNPDCYVPNTDYYVRLYKSSENLSISTKINFGNIFLETSSIQEEIEETIIFTGSDSVSSQKIIQGNFAYNFDGLAFDINHNLYTSNIAYVIGSNTLRTTSKIFGVINISYITKYMKYKFRLSRTGKALISFVVTS